MLKSPEFEVTITGVHAIRLPDEVVKPFLDKQQKRVLAVVRFGDTSLRFYAALLKWQGAYHLTFAKSKQKELGVFPNDYFWMQLFEDKSRYGAEMPEELEAVLQSDPEANHIFREFTAGKKRSIIYMIARYVNSQTRIDKSLLLCKNLKNGLRNTRELLKSR
jgi:hypothetical protein